VRFQARGPRSLHNVLSDVFQENLIDQGLIPNTASASFSTKTRQHGRIEANRYHTPGFVTERRPADAAHRLQAVWWTTIAASTYSSIVNGVSARPYDERCSICC
jgi:hypothetical protein